MFSNLTADAATGVFSAIWTLVWTWGLGIGLIILLLAAAYFSPIAKKDFVYAAIGVAVFMFAYGYGQRNEDALCKAKEAAVTKKVDIIVAKTKTKAYRHRKDPYDDPRN